MPKEPLKERPRQRAKLNSTAKINLEIARIYRRLADGAITPAVATRRVDVLTKLRAGMPEQVEQPAYTPPAISIISIPHDHSVCPDGCTRPNFEAAPLWDAHHACEPNEHNNVVVPMRLLEAPSPRSPEEEQRVIDDLKNEINNLAQKLGVSVVV